MPTYPTRGQPYTTKGEMRKLLVLSVPYLQTIQSVARGIGQPAPALDALLDNIEDALQRAPRRPVGRPKGQ